MLQIEKERSLAKPNQLPAGPRKKRPLGRLFSSLLYMAILFECKVSRKGSHDEMGYSH